MLRPRKKCYSIGRLSYIPVGVGELYYMRILLPMQRGCINYDSIKTVNGKIYGNFQDACYALRLLMDDREYIDAIKEANEIGSRNQLRKFFVTLLFTNTMTKPYVIWTATWKLSANGIVYQKRRQLNIPSLHIEDQQLNYDINELTELHATLLKLLTEEQLDVYHHIIEVVFSNHCQFFFLYGYGGTGKTFLWNTFGIVSLLLLGGRTTHSTFSIPLLMIEESTCSLAQGGDFGQILPVVRKGSKQDILNATINSSELWNHCKVLKFTKNMRLTTAKTNHIANEIKNLVIGFFKLVMVTWTQMTKVKTILTILMKIMKYKANGLCNGTRLQVKHLGQNVITTTVPTSKNFGDTIFITRMNLVPFDVGFPFKFQRRQFPLSLCFVVGLYLPRPVFTHAQLYVAVSRVKSKDGLKMLILDEERKVCTSTKNVVYKEVFENL
ncbi:hypothetical protein HKD37_16G045712 [Glycine soja]